HDEEVEEEVIVIPAPPPPPRPRPLPFPSRHLPNSPSLALWPSLDSGPICPRTPRGCPPLAGGQARYERDPRSVAHLPPHPEGVLVTIRRRASSARPQSKLPTLRLRVQGDGGAGGRGFPCLRHQQPAVPIGRN